MSVPAESYPENVIPFPLEAREDANAEPSSFKILQSAQSAIISLAELPPSLLEAIDKSKLISHVQPALAYLEYPPMDDLSEDAAVYFDTFTLLFARAAKGMEHRERVTKTVDLTRSVLEKLIAGESIADDDKTMHQKLSASATIVGFLAKHTEKGAALYRFTPEATRE